MNDKGKILIVEDDPAMRATLFQALEQDRFQLSVASNLREGEALFGQIDPDVILLDIKLPDGNGKELFAQMKRQNEDVIIIVLTAFPDLRGAISLMKSGAFDYLVKPFDLSELKMAIDRGLELKNLKNEVIRYKRKERHSESFDIIGDSSATRDLKGTILKVAAISDCTVLIMGESGTGKELVAKAIHANSDRRNGPLVAINCSAIPENLVESELFGFEKGAFTDAHQTTKGLFELADGGTLFLDEIGEMPLPLQPKLLRAIESRRIRRIGGNREIPIDCRFVSASNKDLPAAIKQGVMREDLYYRLNVVPISIRPLRERPDDILPLLDYFIGRITKETGLPAIEFSATAIGLLKRYPWPGNAREFKNLVERMMIVHGDPDDRTVMEPRHLPDEIRRLQGRGFTAPDAPQPRTLDEVERDHIVTMMKLFAGNKSEVSRRLGISRNTLKDKLQRQDIR